MAQIVLHKEPLRNPLLTVVRLGLTQANNVTFGGNLIEFSHPCAYFTEGKAKASTLSLSVLVAIEMFNALNALSEVLPVMSALCRCWVRVAVMDMRTSLCWICGLTLRGPKHQVTYWLSTLSRCSAGIARLHRIAAPLLQPLIVLRPEGCVTEAVMS